MKRFFVAFLLLVILFPILGLSESITFIPLEMTLDDFFDTYNKTRGSLPELIKQNEVYVDDVSGKNNIFIQTKTDYGADLVIQFSLNNDGILVGVAPLVFKTSSQSYDLFIATCEQISNVLMPNTEMVKRQAILTRLIVDGVKNGDFTSSPDRAASPRSSLRSALR